MHGLYDRTHILYSTVTVCFSAVLSTYLAPCTIFKCRRIEDCAYRGNAISQSIQYANVSSETSFKYPTNHELSTVVGKATLDNEICICITLVLILCRSAE